MKQLTVNQFKAGLLYFFDQRTRDLRIGEKLVLINILALLEQIDIISKADIVKASDAKNTTTYANIRSLENKGYIQSIRGNQFYSLSYVSLTDKGNLFASRLRRILKG
tara:strand:+ start:476 stop:799 length:324 start_codon:yes stop_codon:yes gene_type:complete